MLTISKKYFWEQNFIKVIETYKTFSDLISLYQLRAILLHKIEVGKPSIDIMIRQCELITQYLNTQVSSKAKDVKESHCTTGQSGSTNVTVTSKKQGAIKCLS